MKDNITYTAMRFSRMSGILETLGNLQEDFFEENIENLLKWAEEFEKSGGKDRVLFFEKKIADSYKDSRG